MLAFVRDVPDKADWNKFKHDYTKQTRKLVARDGLELSSLSDVISAYDRDRLIGIGYISKRKQKEEQSSAYIHVLPSYCQKDIEANVKRLLMIK